MNTYIQILYQIVFGTYRHQHTLDSENREEVYRYISGILKRKKCHAYAIGGVSDHLHIATHLHPMVSLAALVKDIKLALTDYIKRSGILPNFAGWQDGYGAFTYSYREKEQLIRYVKNQENHHQVKSYKEELIDLFTEHGILFDEKYLL